MEHYTDSTKKQFVDPSFWEGFCHGAFSAMSFPVPDFIARDTSGIEQYWKAVGGYIEHSITKHEKEQKRPPTRHS